MGKADPLALALTAIALSAASGVLALPRIDAPCSACTAIASELDRRLEDEPTRNHLDLRHRLDSTGQRYGKVIDYKVSELRAVELLDNLCSSLNNKWSLVVVESSSSKGTKRQTVHWERASEVAPGMRPNSQEDDVRQKHLASFCGSVLDEHDEEITDAIKQGILEEKGASQWLCHELVGACPVGSGGTKTSRALPRKGSLPETSDGTTTVSMAAAVAAAKAAAEPPPPPSPPQETTHQIKSPSLNDANFQAQALEEAAKIAGNMGFKIEGYNDVGKQPHASSVGKKKSKRQSKQRKPEL